MRSIRLLFILVVMHLIMVVLSPAQEGEEVIRIYDQIKNVSLDDQKVAEVESLVLKRDAAIFRLNKGKICLFQPVEGRVTGAVFLGEGVFEFSAPTEIERYQLKKFTKQETLSEGFDELFLWFSDTTAQELEHKLIFSKGDVSTEFTVMASDCRRRRFKGESQRLGCHILEEMLCDSSATSEQGPGFFYADIKTENLDYLFYIFEPCDVEEVVLEKRAPGYVRARDLVCSFHREADYLKNARVKDTPITGEEKNVIKITHYDMDVEISIAEKVSAKVKVDFESLVDGVRIIEFSLHPDLKIERITGELGDSLCFVKERDEYGVAVVLSRPTNSGETRQLTFQYSGKVIAQDIWTGSLVVYSDYWYPRYPPYGPNRRSTYDLRFKSPKQYQFFSVGRKTKEWIEGDFLCTEWKVEVPVHIVAFDYDNFDTYEDSVEGLPSVCVNYLKEAHRKLASHEMYGWFRSWEYTKSKENAAADVINSLNFFQMVYGKCPFSKIVAAEIPASHGRGLPGLVRLSFGSFAQDEHFERNKFRLRSFRGHEVSHQWWGQLVGWQTYHDQWLSEGFAEYSGAWFAQMSMQDNEAFFDELEEWKEDIMGKGFKGSVGSKAGPIWLGHRLNSSESSDYGTVVYEKGAYVLHMLRNMMMNYETRSDSSFIAMMRDFVETYYGKEASTEDFKEMVEKHVGEDMDWFFDQWVYGIEIPTYEFSYTTKETPGGKYIVTCEVDQENVSEDFKMWVPILLDFGMDQHAILRLWVDKPHNVYQLPKAPMMPRQVTLNPAHAVLCEVKTRH